MAKHLRDELLDASWLHRDNLRSDSIPDRALSAASGPSPDIGAGSDRPSPVTSSLADGSQTGEGTFHRSWVSSGSHVPSSPSSDESLSRRLHLDPPRSRPSEPTGILSLVPAVRGVLGGMSEFERPDPRFGEVPGRGAR